MAQLNELDARGEDADVRPAIDQGLGDVLPGKRTHESRVHKLPARRKQCSLPNILALADDVLS